MLSPDNNSTYLKCKGQLNSRYDKQPATTFPLQYICYPLAKDLWGLVGYEVGSRSIYH